MKRIILFALTLILSVGVTSSQGYLINGLLDDWGVEPHVQWIPSSMTTSWIEEDNWGSASPTFPSGGELYDVEAMYCDIADGMVYVALVTSFPAAGFYSSLPGDFGIDLDRDGIFEYGLKTTGSHAGGLYANPIWSHTTSYPLSSPAQIIGGTLLDTQPLVYSHSGIVENGFPTYLIEGRMDWSSLGQPFSPFDLHWTMTCGNDLLNMTVNPVPEPTSMILLAPGLAALWGLWRKKRPLRH